VFTCEFLELKEVFKPGRERIETGERWLLFVAEDLSFALDDRFAHGTLSWFVIVIRKAPLLSEP
jgi:hypothetical protein